MKMVMLYRKISFIVLMSIVLLCISCTQKKKIVEYDLQEIADIRARTLNMSQSILGEEEYYAIYKMANDSISDWQKHELGLWKYYGVTVDYQLDSVFCVNELGNKMFFSILRRKVEKTNTADGISLEGLIWSYLVNIIRKIFIPH